MAPSRRELLVRYFLEHRTAIFAAGFLLLFDQLLTDWLASREAFALFGREGSLVVKFVVVVLALVLAFIGARGLRRRVARLRTTRAPGRTGFALELFVLVGALALVVNLILRGTAAAPLVIVSLPAAMLLVFDIPAREAEERKTSPFNLGGRDHA